MRTPISYPARAAIAVRIPRPATSTLFVFPAHRNGHAMTEIMHPASPILIGHNPGGRPVIPRVPLVLTGPARPSVPQARSPGKVSGAGPGWPGPGRDRSGRWLAQRGRRPVRPGRRRGGGQLHRPVPDGRRHPPPPGDRRPGGRDPRRRRPRVRLPGHRAGAARPPRPAGPGAEPGLGRRQRVHERDRRRARLAEPGHLGDAAGGLRAGQRHLDRRRPRLGPGPPPAPGRHRGRRHRHPAGHPRRPDLVAAAAGPGPGLHPGRVPRLGAEPNARSPPAAAPRPPRRPARAVRARGGGRSRGRRPRPAGS